jgi:hypothetical protein
VVRKIKFWSLLFATLKVFSLHNLFFSFLLIILFGACGDVGGQNNSPDKKEFEKKTVQSDSVCPPEGSAQSERIKALNRLKNRTQFPEEKDFDKMVSFERIVEPGYDKARWDFNKAARIKGYVYDVKPGGTETCNCKAREKELKDTHIEIVLDPMDETKSKRFIIEVTPRMRNIMKRKGLNWTTSALRDKFLGRWVEIEGWMFFDEEHANSSENTNPGKENNWRATAWEIHPVTKLEVINRPR